MKVSPGHDILYDYVFTRDKTFSLKGVRHRQRSAHLAAAARRIWNEAKGISPEDFLHAPRSGMMWSYEKTIAQSIIAYENAP